MKRFALSLAAGLLLSTIASVVPARAESAPRSSDCVSSEVAAPVAVSFEQNLTPAPVPLISTTPPSWCTARTSNYCTYNGWNRQTRCCYATYISPGAYCPTICE